MNSELSVYTEDPKMSAWGKNPKLQCNYCLNLYGVAEWTDNLALVITRDGDKLACILHDRKRRK